MKRVVYKKHINADKNLKLFAIRQTNEDKDSRTQIGKRFIYRISLFEGECLDLQAPQIFIKKRFDSKKRTEEFSFRVRGYFFIKQEHSTIKVEFRHALRIRMTWKTKIFSPDKSEMLT